MASTLTPQPVTDLELAFGGDVSRLLPPMDEIPEEFHRHPGTGWNRLVSAWFFRGLEALEVEPKEGIDKNAALRHVKAVMGSWQPKHEHKEAGIAYLLSQWFESATWTPKGGEREEATS